MSANVLNSKRAVRMSVFVVRAFVKLRETALQYKELAAKISELEKSGDTRPSHSLNHRDNLTAP